MTDKVLEHLDKIAQKLGVAVEYLFATVAKQMVVEGIVWSLVIITLFLTSLLLTIKFAKRINPQMKAAKEAVKAHKSTLYSWDKEKIEEEHINQLDVAVLIGSAVILILSLFPLFISLPDQIMKIANPEYYAIKEIMNMISGG